MLPSGAVVRECINSQVTPGAAFDPFAVRFLLTHPAGRPYGLLPAICMLSYRGGLPGYLLADSWI